MKAAIKATAGSAPLVVLSTRALRHLVAEVGNDDQALRFLLRQAERTGKPIGFNLELADGESKTFFLAPSGWSDERLQSWIAGHHEILSDQFGVIEKVSRHA